MSLDHCTAETDAGALYAASTQSLDHSGMIRFKFPQIHIVGLARHWKE